MDREHRTTYVNQSMADMLGYEPAEMIGKKVEDFFFPEDMESHQTHMEKRHSGQDEVYERRFRLRDGSQLWTLASARVQKDSQGNFNGSFAMFTDITKRKQAEESLRESEEKYHGLMESLNNAISTVDQYGTFLYMNDMAAESLGGTPQELIGKKIQEVFPEPFASRQLAAVLGVIQTDRDTWYETQSMVKNGLRWFRVAFQPLHDKAGQVAQILVNVTDIHDLKTAQQELQELNRTLEEKVSQRTAEVQDLYNNAPTGYHSLDIGGNFVMVNKTELNWLGYTREELIGRAAWDILTEDSRGIFREKFPLFLQQGWLKDLELEFVRKDGSILPVSLTATAIHDGDGNFVMSRSSILDITERKEAERALRESGEQNRLLFEESPSPIALLDETGHIIRTNHAYEQLTGVPRSRLYGKTAEEMGLVEPEVTKRLAESMIESMSRQENFARAEYCLVSADGTKRIVESHIFILQINSVNHVLVTVNDISMHKKAEETLRRANLELEHAMRVKDEFLATMSHELRTPLTGILGLSEALQLETYGSLTDRQVKTIRNIENSGRHLLELINDVLDLSKIEAGKLELEITHCSLEDIFQSSLQLTKGMAHQKRQRVSYSMSIDPIFLDVDSRRIKQVMVNLISNAIKFTPEDGELGLMVEQDKTNRQVRLIVWDKGIGIKPENLPKLFQPFTQIDSSLAREYSGTGLGLALVRRLVELHNGSVEVESIFGTGSRFIVTLPYVAPSLPDNSLPAEGIKELQHGATDEDLSSPMILIVDDNQLLLDMMSDFLEAKQFRTVKSQSGRELLEKIEDINPDVILMDIQMPVMDGLEAIRRIRAHKNAKIASTLIIAVTALAMPGDREKCLETGANEYLSKPIFLAQLVERIREFLKDKDGRQST
jgi:PAS domain S-box-containing protein